MIYKTVLRTLSAALLSGCFINALWAAVPVEFVVAPHGADAGPGSKAGPFATLARAQQAVRQALSRDRSCDVTVWIDAGTYELEKPLSFGPEDAPSGTARVIYRALDDKAVVISGGQPLSGWTTNADGAWTLVVPGAKEGKWYPRQLFINEARRTRARTPNEGFHRGLQSGDARRFVFRPGVLRAWTHPEDVELVSIVEWTTSRVRLGKLDAANNTVEFSTKIIQFFDEEWGQHIRSNLRNFPFYFENAPEMMDAPGEWHLDRPTGRLCYLPMPGEQLSQAVAVMPRLEQLIVVRGNADQPVRNLEFRGLTFAHTDWTLPQDGFFPDQAGFFDTQNVKKGLPVPAAALDFQYATGCVLEDCRVTKVGGHAVRFREGCISNVVAGCTIEGVGGNGVSLGLFDRATAALEVVRGNSIRECTIRRCGLDYAGSVGIWVGIAQDSMIVQNEIGDIPYTGISVGWRWDRTPVGVRGNVIEGNHIHHVAQLLADAGGLYTLGDQPGGVIRGNYIHDIKRFSGVAMVNGIFFDNGSRGWRVEDNVIHDVADGAIRHNDNLREDQFWGTNYLDLRPDSPGFPAHLTQRAGPHSPRLSSAAVNSGGRVVWTGKGADDKWSTAANWQPARVPALADNVVLDGTSTNNSRWDGEHHIASLTITPAYKGQLIFAGHGAIEGDVVLSGRIHSNRDMHQWLWMRGQRVDLSGVTEWTQAHRYSGGIDLGGSDEKLGQTFTAPKMRIGDLRMYEKGTVVFAGPVIASLVEAGAGKVIDFNHQNLTARSLGCAAQVKNLGGVTITLTSWAGWSPFCFGRSKSFMPKETPLIDLAPDKPWKLMVKSEEIEAYSDKDKRQPFAFINCRIGNCDASGGEAILATDRCIDAGGNQSVKFVP